MGGAAGGDGGAGRCWWSSIRDSGCVREAGISSERKLRLWGGRGGGRGRVIKRERINDDCLIRRAP